MLLRAARTLEVSEFHNGDWRVRVTLNRLIISCDLEDGRFRRSEIDLDCRRTPQLLSECLSRFLLFVLLHVLNDLRFTLRKVAADALFVLVIKLLRLRLCYPRDFRAHLRFE